MLYFDNVTLTQGNFSLSADFEVNPGLTAVIGPSGAGKSTLLSAVAGFLVPQIGVLRWNSVDMAGHSPAQRPVAMLFQDHNLFPHLTLAQNVGLGLAPRLRLTPDQAKAVQSALGDVGLGDLADRKPGEVSGGQQSRAALARVLVQDRPVVCLDEPFSALGPGQREEMLTLVAKVLTGRTVLLVTHDPEEARSAAEMAIFVSDGRAEPPTPLAALLDTPPPALARYLRRSG